MDHGLSHRILMQRITPLEMFAKVKELSIRKLAGETGVKKTANYAAD